MSTNAGIDTLAGTLDATNGRIRSLDLLRGAAIIGVIIIHILFGLGRGYDVVWRLNPTEFLYAGLPMFMVITGYLHRPGKTFSQNVKHRVVPLIMVLFVSTIVLTTIMYCYMYFLGYDLEQYNLFKDICEILIGKECFSVIGTDSFHSGLVLAPYDISAGFYYLQILAVGLLIFYAVVDEVIDDWKETAITILALLCVTAFYLATIDIQLPFSAQLGPVVAAFLLFGALLRRYNVAEFIENGYRSAKYWLVLAVSLGVGCVFVYFFPSGMRLYNSTFGSYGEWSVFTFFILAISCGMVLWYIAALMVRIPLVSSFFILAGMNSIILFSQHMFIAKLITAPFYDIGTEYWITIDDLSIRVAVLIASIGLTFALMNIVKRLSGTLDENNTDDLSWMTQDDDLRH